MAILMYAAAPLAGDGRRRLALRGRTAALPAVWESVASVPAGGGRRYRPLGMAAAAAPVGDGAAAASGEPTDLLQQGKKTMAASKKTNSEKNNNNEKKKKKKVVVVRRQRSRARRGTSASVQGLLPMPYDKLDDYATSAASSGTDINKIQHDFLKKRDQILEEYHAKGYVERDFTDDDDEEERDGRGAPGRRRRRQVVAKQAGSVKKIN
ncbi:hypothetical protein BRADI_4g12080v3 [Brachypodium distachyon]|uniref:Uncharacterized protein n=1 Tax=Brachypodium distachyon TaxID=15368 RepID=A0A0Q3PE86_BRADI|nr:hypothetical protein BRADI_4g12080v3 [Brachypodium distachyon]